MKNLHQSELALISMIVTTLQKMVRKSHLLQMMNQSPAFSLKFFANRICKYLQNGRLLPERLSYSGCLCIVSYFCLFLPVEVPECDFALSMIVEWKDSLTPSFTNIS